MNHPEIPSAGLTPHGPVEDRSFFLLKPGVRLWASPYCSEHFTSRIPSVGVDVRADRPAATGLRPSLFVADVDLSRRENCDRRMKQQVIGNP